MSNKPKILCVDDETSILQALRRVLRKEEFDITTTDSPAEALRHVDEHTFAVVVADQRMPEMEGTELLEQVWQRSPETIRITLTGYADIQAAKDAINRGHVYRYLDKPWNDDDLRQTIRQAVEQYNLVQENKRLTEELRDLNENLKHRVMERTLEVLRLNQSLEESFMGAVRAMARLAEMHSPLMGGHSRRVAAVAKAVAKQLGVPAKTLRQVEIAAALHDIGKVPIDASILSKPEQYLNPTERKILRKHPLQGEAIVRMVPGLDDAASYVRHHHERFDGNGYPDGLAGTDIPLGARIIAVVDAYDRALHARDAYASMTPTQALRILRARHLVKFDPEIVEILGDLTGENRPSTDDDASEIEIPLQDLKPGMVPSRDLVSSRGVRLLTKGQMLMQDHIQQLIQHHTVEPFLGGLFVYRQWPPVAVG